MRASPIDPRLRRHTNDDYRRACSIHCVCIHVCISANCVCVCVPQSRHACMRYVTIGPWEGGVSPSSPPQVSRRPHSHHHHHARSSRPKSQNPFSQCCSSVSFVLLELLRSCLQLFVHYMQPKGHSSRHKLELRSAGIPISIDSEDENDWVRLLNLHTDNQLCTYSSIVCSVCVCTYSCIVCSVCVCV